MSSSELFVARWLARVGRWEGEFRRKALDALSSLTNHLRSELDLDAIIVDCAEGHLSLVIAAEREQMEQAIAMTDRWLGLLDYALTLSRGEGETLLSPSAGPYRAGADLATRIGLELMANGGMNSPTKGLPDASSQASPIRQELRRSPTYNALEDEDIFWALANRRSPDGSHTCMDILLGLAVG